MQHRIISLLLLCLFAFQPVATLPINVIASTFSIQDIHIINDNKLRHYSVATIRISFDNNLLLSSTTNNATAQNRIPITQATPSQLYGLTRLQCEDHLIESTPSMEYEDTSLDNHRGIGQNIPQYLYPITPVSVTYITHNNSTPFRTIVQTVYASEKPRDNEYMIILVVNPKSTLFTAQYVPFDASNYKEEDYALQKWNLEELDQCKLHFLEPNEQITPDGNVLLSGDFGSSSESFHGTITNMIRTEASVLNVQEAHVVFKDTHHGIVHHEKTAAFASDLDDLLDLATQYDRYKKNKIDILSGARDERDVNNEMVDENEYGYPNENANENGNDGSTDSNNDDDDDDDDEKINQRVNSHISKVSNDFSHSGMIVSLLEVMHRMGNMETMETTQYWELVEDGLTNMMIPNFVKMGVALTKAPILDMIVNMLVPILIEIIICPIISIIWPQAECFPNGEGAADPDAPPPPLPEEEEEACRPPGPEGVCGTPGSCKGEIIKNRCSGGTDNVCCVERIGEICKPPGDDGICGTPDSCTEKGGTIEKMRCSGGTDNVCCLEKGGGAAFALALAFSLGGGRGSGGSGGGPNGGLLF